MVTFMTANYMLCCGNEYEQSHLLNNFYVPFVAVTQQQVQAVSAGQEVKHSYTYDKQPEDAGVSNTWRVIRDVIAEFQR